MRYEIRHVTQYQYDEPVRESVMELWMQPLGRGPQRLIEFDLDIDPMAKVFAYADSWGNTVHHFDVPHAHSRLTIGARSLVQTEAPTARPDALGMDEWDRIRGEAVRGDCWDFLRRAGFAAESGALAAFRETHGVDSLTNRDPLTALRALSGLIYGALDYEHGVTAADSPIDDALAAGRGVCQDFAHLMIAICRGWGLPARYVSGYLAAHAGDDRSDPDASHAWVEVYLPSLGWLGFDPTNNTLAGERHIAVAIGRDYADVPPTRGVFKGDAESHLSVGVSVRAAEAGPGQPEYLRMGAPAIAARRRRAQSAAHQHHQQQ